MIKQWFDKWFQKQCKKAWDEAECDTDEPEKFKKTSKKHIEKNDNDIIDDMSCYTFKMQPAEGGTIIQIIHFSDKQNQRGERWIKELYIIPDATDLAEGLTDILMQYKLKHM